VGGAHGSQRVRGAWRLLAGADAGPAVASALCRPEEPQLFFAALGARLQRKPLLLRLLQLRLACRRLLVRLGGASPLLRDGLGELYDAGVHACDV